MGKEIKWVLGQGAGVISPWNGGLIILSRGTGTYCNAYTPSLRMRGVDF